MRSHNVSGDIFLPIFSLRLPITINLFVLRTRTFSPILPIGGFSRLLNYECSLRDACQELPDFNIERCTWNAITVFNKSKSLKSVKPFHCSICLMAFVPGEELCWPAFGKFTLWRNNGVLSRLFERIAVILWLIFELLFPIFGEPAL